MRSYHPDELVSKLSVNQLPDPTEVTVYGLVKLIDDSPSVLQFSDSLRCESWLTMPIEIVESINHLKTVTCKDHEHPLVELKFKQPDEARQDVAFVLALLSRTQTALSHALLATRADATSNRTAALTCPDRECVYVNTPQGLEICCYCPNTHERVECTGIV